MKSFVWFLLALLLLSIPALWWLFKDHSSPETVAEKAYIYGYPLVLMDKTREVMTSALKPESIKAPLNQFVRLRDFPDPKWEMVVSPNADTLYMSGWLDLSNEPQVISVPNTGDRYYILQILDQWTNALPPIGTRLTGNRKGDYAIIGPDWHGVVPSGIKEIRSPTDLVWVIGRIKTGPTQDFEAVHQIQDQIKLYPLSAHGKEYNPPLKSAANEINVKEAPVDQVESLNAQEFFITLSQLLKKNPPPNDDNAIVSQFEKIGLVPGEEFIPENLSSDVLEDLNRGVDTAKRKIKEAWVSGDLSQKVNNWSLSHPLYGQFGNDYLLRAATAFGALGVNLRTDALYPKTYLDSRGKLLNGNNSYVIHFPKGKFPPAEAFWSITLYNDRHLFYPNAINRYKLGSSDNLKLNPDGSLDIYISNISPGEGKESNWLPAPAAPFNLIMRLYQPGKSALEGVWTPPPVKLQQQVIDQMK